MQPLLYAALALAAGIVAAASGPASLAPIPVVWTAVMLAGSLALAAVWRGRSRAATVLGLLLCAMLGYGRAAALRAHPRVPGLLAQTALALQQQPRRRVFVTGYVRDRPQLLYDAGQASAVRLDLQATTLAASAADPQLRTVSGGVRLYAYPPRQGQDPGWAKALLRLPAGVGLAARLHLRPLRHYRDPGVPDFSQRERRQGIVVTATLPLKGWQRWPMALHADRLAAARAHLWGWLSMRLDELAPPAQAPGANALLRGMLLGDVARLSERTRTNFQIDGIYHLLVVAGLHIGVLAMLLWWLLARLRCPRLTAGGLSLLLLAGYAWVIAGRTPTLRALLMLVIYFGAEWWYRERQALNAVGGAALLLLVWHPLDLYQASFQMSFGAALLLAGVALPLLRATSLHWRMVFRNLKSVALDVALETDLAARRVRMRRVAERLAGIWQPLGWKLWPGLMRILLYLYDVVMISAVLQLGLAAFNTVYFHRASPWALVANAVLVPAAALLIPLGWLSVLAAELGPGAAHAAGWLIGGLAQRMLALAAVLARWPAANWRVPSPPGWFLALFGAAAALWIAAGTLSGKRPRWRRWAGASSALMLALTLVLAAAPFPPRLPPGLSATILDVGQGDSIFVSFPDGRTLLVDGGPRSARWDSGQEIVAPFLWSLGLHRLGAVLLTHAHNDHLGGLFTVVADFHPREVWVTRTLPQDAATRGFLREVRARHARLRQLAAGDAFRVGGSRIAVLLPSPDYRAGPTPVNDDSMVVRVSHDGEAMLLEGDAEAVGEHWLLAHHVRLASAVLKVGHHGSKTSSTPAFLRAVRPQAAVISVGADNSYGQPAAPVLDDLRAAGARVFRTDRDGAVQCRLLDGQLSVYLFRQIP
ncbi:MAG: ComEC/Rec2 family competence protein [Terriglobales bacterium]